MGDEQDLWHVIALRASSAPDPAPDRWLSNVFPSTNEKSSLSSSLVLILIVLKENSVLYCVHSNLNAWPFIHDTKGDPSSNFVIVQ